MKNTDSTVGENTRNAFVYIHIFADGSKYFGNGVKVSRPFVFSNSGRGKKYQEALKKYGEPVVQIRRALTIVKADTLERELFDRYIATGGVALQKRPSGEDLQTAVARNSLADPQKMSKPRSEEAKVRMASAQNRPEVKAKKSVANAGKPKSQEAKRKMSIAKLGNTNALGTQHTEVTKRKMSIAQSRPEVKAKKSIAQKGKLHRGHRKVISMLDGRVSTAAQSSRWNKKNPDYIGTWVDL
jgi:hypothetical protein